MTEPKPVRVTSPTNAWALAAQLIAFLIPVLSVAEIYQPVALEAISVPLADAWQWLLFVMAGLSLSASLLMLRDLGGGNRIRATLRLEGATTAIVAICFGVLWAALVREYGFGANPLTQLLVGGLGLAALARVAQIIYELWKIRRALRSGQTAHVEAIAQPKET